jgi:hypothetical protein
MLWMSEGFEYIWRNHQQNCVAYTNFRNGGVRVWPTGTDFSRVMYHDILLGLRVLLV